VLLSSTGLVLSRRALHTYPGARLIMAPVARTRKGVLNDVVTVMVNVSRQIVTSENSSDHKATIYCIDTKELSLTFG
jgi:hypothetical protein